MESDAKPQTESVIACDPEGITPDQRDRWVHEVVPKLYGAVQEIRELPDGWAWRLPNDPEILLLAAEDLNIERLCCPFVRYSLEIEPDSGPFWLRMTGRDGVKEFLRMAFESASYFDPQIAKAAGLKVSGNVEKVTLEAALSSVDDLNERFARSRA
jgi:hypothetical protein